MLVDECEELAFEIAVWMQALEDPAPSLTEHERLTRELCGQLRALAVMVLLASGRSDRFHHNLIRSGRLRLGFLGRCRREGATEAHDFVSGLVDPLLDAMAAADWALVAAIGDAGPSSYRPGHEYEDDHCYARLLVLLAKGGDAVAESGPLVQRMQRVPGVAGPRADVGAALAARDQAAFDIAFEALLGARDAGIDIARQRGELASPSVLALRQVSIEGLALLRLAERTGLQTAADYRHCPALARLAMLEPLPPGD